MEEEALEQARRGMRAHNSEPEKQLNSLAPAAPPAAAAAAATQPAVDPAEKARLERERLRQKERESRRQQAKANAIDMNRQSDLMAAFEENLG